MDTHFLFNFIRFVCGEQVFVPAHLFSYADLAVGIYSTSILLIIGTAEIMDFLVSGIRVIP